MRQRTDKSSNSTPQTPATPREPENAFSAEFLRTLGHRDPCPATPEADNAGPWTVVRESNSDTPWACHAAGEPAPRARLREPDLAYLVAAALEVSGHPPRFRVQEDAEGTLHLLTTAEDGRAVGRLSRWSGELVDTLGPLDLLRSRPLALAHFLLGIDDQTLARTGRLLAELAGEAS